MNAWLMLAYGPDRAYGGNTGYDDRTDRYTFDSNVPNWKRVAVGDLAVVATRDPGTRLPLIVATAQVRRITRGPSRKTVRRCPKCRHPRFKERLTKVPRWRCDFGHEFDAPLEEPVDVTSVIAWFGDTYQTLAQPVSFERFRTAQIHAHNSNAIRPLNLLTATGMLGLDVGPWGSSVGRKAT